MSYFYGNIGERKISFKEVKKIIDLFFEDSNIQELSLKFKISFEINEEDYRQLIELAFSQFIYPLNDNIEIRINTMELTDNEKDLLYEIQIVRTKKL
ncbi:MULTISPECIES: AcrID1 family anti-CRISPR protein [Bacteria]|uniref:Uncharacterized protein n=3 Tax=root TaxID=1 RepID=A0A1B3SN35_9VIRU|nr:AcrID1 family anti-CRISPR protein [Sulfolobus islandicus]YP_009272994.1 AcrID1 family anti-CRISPR protein [Sulfolobus islandicus rudivirus 3]AOG61600.1 hypothetical protein [Sulfolobus islandicus rod-shaped virus 3]